MSGWVVGAGRGERRFHDFEELLAAGTHGCAVRHLPEHVYPVVQTDVEILEDEEGQPYRAPLMLLWSDGHLEYVRRQLRGLPELDRLWLQILSLIRSGRPEPGADFQARQRLLTLLSAPGAHERPSGESDSSWEQRPATSLQIHPDSPLRLLGVTGRAGKAYYFSDDRPDAELLTLHVDTNLVRLTDTYTLLSSAQEDVLELPPGHSLEQLAEDLIYVQMAGNEENLGITWYLTEPREREYAEVLMMTHPEYRLHPPGTPTNQTLDFYLNWETRSRPCPPEEINQHVTPAQRIALLRLLEGYTESAELCRLIRARIRQLEHEPQSRPLDYEQGRGECKVCHEAADLNQFGECPECGSLRLMAEWPGE